MKKEIISMGLGLLSMIVIWGAGNSLAKAEENPLTEEKWWAKVEAESGAFKYPDKVILYVDGKEVSSAKVNIDYPMIQLISLYEKREGGWTGSWEWQPYPNSFEIRLPQSHWL
ncbi:hypothetical protein [Acetivibrio ethanolgignens]|uniref:Uncharacterized protein n=1 Tax=Acetivibrio ethanolgignens TaxID=290052 RepID=A0A0V8QHQ8_9FIRM|nr:hypothetical protein [Acetivibrio ethanolgignens]KSV60123.1 hypothetical protein ASU35_06865 [Acetivibrio ethanolgignens]